MPLSRFLAASVFHYPIRIRFISSNVYSYCTLKLVVLLRRCTLLYRRSNGRSIDLSDYHSIERKH